MKRALVLLSLVACGSSTKAAPDPSTPAETKPADSAAAAPETAPVAPESKTAGIPAACAGKDDVCVPDPGFVKRLCDGSFPDVALALFAKDAPFTRVYMKSDVDGWNADGGASARAKLFFDEEVLVLKKRAAPKNGIVVGAGGGYLVMRWDGNCYTLDDNQVTSKRPPAPKHAALPWRFYAEPTKNALLKAPKVLAAYQRRGKECKGATSGDVTKACEQADAALSASVVGEIRGGAQIPTPEKLP